jgi:tetratricopeptide (TPR) repeat protein
MILRNSFLYSSLTGTWLLSVVLLVCLPFTAVGQSPRTADDFNNRGLQRQNQGDLDGAIEDYTKALSLKATAKVHAVAYNNRANARLAKNDIDGAVADYGKAIELQPMDFENYYNRGIDKHLMPPSPTSQKP